MADDLKIKVSTEFEEVADMGKKLEAKLKQLASMTKLNIKLDADNTSISGVEAQVKNAQYKIEKIFAKPIKINAGLDGMAYSEIQKRLSNIRQSVDSLAKVSINTNKTGKIQSAIIEYRDEAGKVTKEFMNWHNHLDKVNEKIKRVFGTTKLTFVDDINKADTSLQKSLDTLSRFEKSLSKINVLYNSTSGVKETNNLNTLNTKYNNILQIIERLKNSNTALSAEQKRDIDLQINNLSNLVAKYRDLERTQEKGFNYKGFRSADDLVKLKSAQDAYTQSLLQGNRVIQASIQETESYYKITQQLQKGNIFTNIGVYMDKTTGKMYEFSRSMKDNMIDTLTWQKALSTALILSAYVWQHI